MESHARELIGAEVSKTNWLEIWSPKNNKRESLKEKRSASKIWSDFLFSKFILCCPIRSVRKRTRNERNCIEIFYSKLCETHKRNIEDEQITKHHKNNIILENRSAKPSLGTCQHEQK